MTSSTSSSDRASSAWRGGLVELVRVCTLVAKCVAPTSLVFAALFGATAIFRVAGASVNHDASIEDVLVHVQSRRAHGTSHFDIVLGGDSSGLAGIDPLQLGAALGASCESVQTMAVVGPAANVDLVEAELLRHRASATVVFSMNARGMNVSEERIRPWEQRISASEAPVRIGALPGAARDLGYNFLGAHWVDLPLPGAFGRAYGWPEQLARSIDRLKGGMSDPNLLLHCDSEPVRFRVSDAVRSRLQRMRRLHKGKYPARIYLLFTPSPSECLSPTFPDDRKLAVSEVLAETDLTPESVIDSPPSLPMRLFATMTHLNAQGREVLTDAIGDTLLAHLRRGDP